MSKDNSTIAENRRKLYDAASSMYNDLGTFEQFSARMDDEGSRRKFYNAVSGDFSDLGSWEDFNARVYSPVSETSGLRPQHGDVATEVPTEAPTAPATTGGWQPTEQEKIAMSMNMHGMMNDFRKNMKSTTDRIHRMGQTLSPEWQKEKSAREMRVRMAGGKTKLMGFAPTQSGSAKSSAQNGGEAPVVSEQSPVPYDVKYSGGKPVTQWLMPDGSLTTDLVSAENAEYTARGARLRREERTRFDGRMRDNGLDPSNEDDRRTQATIDAIQSGDGIDADKRADIARILQDNGLSIDNPQHVMWAVTGNQEKVLEYRLKVKENDLKRLINQREAWRSEHTSKEEAQHKRYQKYSTWEKLYYLGDTWDELMYRSKGVRPQYSSGAGQIQTPHHSVTGASPSNPYDEDIERAQAEVLKISQSLRDYRNLSSASGENWFGKTVQGLWDGISDPNSWTAGIIDLSVNDAIRRADTSTEAGRSLLTAAAMSEQLMAQAPNPGGWYQGGNFVGEMFADPVTYASVFAGKGASALATSAMERKAAKKMGDEVAKRYMAGSLAVRIGGAAAGSGANFMTFEGLRDMRQQLIDGGWTDSDGVFHEGFSMGHALRQGGHGLIMGTTMGVFGATVGNVFDPLVKGTSSTAGKMALRTGQYGVSLVGEGTIFAMPEIIEFHTMDDDRFDRLYADKFGYAGETDAARRKAARETARSSLSWDAWTDSQAMIFSMKVAGKMTHPLQSVSSVTRTIEDLKSKGERDHTSFMERLSKVVDRSPLDVVLTKSERKEMEAAGYGDLAGMFVRKPVNRNVNEVKNNPVIHIEQENGSVYTVESTTGREAGTVETSGARGEFDGYDEFQRFMSDRKVSQAVRAKAYYILTGHLLPMGTVSGYTKEVSADGSIRVNSVTADGEVVTSRVFTDVSKAAVEIRKIERQVELNTIDVGERYAETGIARVVLDEVKDAVGARHRLPAEAIENIYDKYLRGEEVSGKEAEIVDEVNAAAEASRERYVSLTPEAMRNSVKEEYGVDVDEALRKPYKERTEKEKEAVSKYSSMLYEEAERLRAAKRTFAGQAAEMNAEQRQAARESWAMQRDGRLIEGGSEPARPIGRAVMKYQDRPVEVLSGRVVMTEDGTMVDKENSDATVVIRDNATGKVEMVAPDAILSYEEYAAPAEEVAAAPTEPTPETEEVPQTKYTSGQIKIRNEDGSETRGVLTGYVDENGNHEYFVEGDLQHLHYASDHELDNILSDYQPDAPQEPVDENGVVFEREDGSEMPPLSMEEAVRMVDEARKIDYYELMDRRERNVEGGVTEGTAETLSSAEAETGSRSAGELAFEPRDSFRVSIAGRTETQHAAVVSRDGDSVTVWTPFALNEMSRKAETMAGYITVTDRGALEAAIERDADGNAVDYVSAAGEEKDEIRGQEVSGNDEVPAESNGDAEGSLRLPHNEGPTTDAEMSAIPDYGSMTGPWDLPKEKNEAMLAAERRLTAQHKDELESLFKLEDEDFERAVDAFEDKMPDGFVVKLRDEGPVIEAATYMEPTYYSQEWLDNGHRVWKVGDRESYTRSGDYRPFVVTKVDENGKLLEAIDGEQGSGGRVVIRGGRILSREEILSALSKIPVGEDGRPRFEAVDARTAAEGLIEAAGGDETKATKVAGAMAENARASVEKIRKRRPKKVEPELKGDDPLALMEQLDNADRVHSEKERKWADELSSAEGKAVKWEQIRQVFNTRRAMSDMARRQSDEEQARRAEAERARAEAAEAKAREDAERRVREREAAEAERLERERWEQSAEGQAVMSARQLAEEAADRAVESSAEPEVMDAVAREDKYQGARQYARAYDRWGAPASLDEWVARALSVNDGREGRVRWSGENGLESVLFGRPTQGERDGRSWMTSDANGMSFDEWTHRIWESLMGDVGDVDFNASEVTDHDVRNVVIDQLLRHSTSRSLFELARTLHGGVATGDTERRAEAEYNRSAIEDEWYEQTLGISREDFEAREAEAYRYIREELNDEAAFEYILNQQIEEYEQRRIEEEGAVGAAVLPGARVDNAGAGAGIDGRGRVAVVGAGADAGAGTPGGTVLPVAERGGQGNIHSTQRPEPRNLSQTEAEGLTLSEETDHNDLPLLTASDGTTTFGAIREGEGIQAGVIKLSLGFDRIVKVDGKDVHRGYGYEHIDAQRGDVIRAAGFGTVTDFVEYVSKNYTSIKKGGKRNGKDTFIIEVPQTDSKGTNVLYIELSADGEYWNVNSGGIFRSDYTKNKEVIAKKEKTDNSLPALETSPATVDGKVQDTSKGGNLLSGNSSLSESSERKVSDFASDKQEKGAESSGSGEVKAELKGRGAGADAGAGTPGDAAEGTTKQERLSKEDATDIIAKMEMSAVSDPKISLSPESWQNTFGLSNSIDTPLGKVKMGEGQYQKLVDKKRSAEFGMVVQTLQDPDVVFIEPSEAKDGQITERGFSYVFVKTFIRDGKKFKYYTSVSVLKDGMEVSVSSHIANKTAIMKKLQGMERAYTKESLLPNSSEWHLAEHPSDVPDLLPTQGKSEISERKVSDFASDKQEKGAESSGSGEVKAELKGHGAGADAGAGTPGDADDNKHRNILLTEEVTEAERAEMAGRIMEWLSEENLSSAFGKNRDEIFNEFGNELKPIACISTEDLHLLSPDITDPRIYCGKGYFIDHALRNHGAAGTQVAIEDVNVSDYLKIQGVLDKPDCVKESDVDGKRTVIFIKKIGRYYAELAQVGEDGRIVLHKSLFNQKKEPYARLNDIRQRNTSSEGGTSSISHAENTAPAISLESRGDVISASKLQTAAFQPHGLASGRKVSDFASDKQEKGAESSVQPTDNKGVQTIQTAVEAASSEVNTEPTPAQAEAGNYKKGHDGNKIDSTTKESASREDNVRMSVAHEAAGNEQAYNLAKGLVESVGINVIEVGDAEAMAMLPGNKKTPVAGQPNRANEKLTSGSVLAAHVGGSSSNANDSRNRDAKLINDTQSAKNKINKYVNGDFDIDTTTLSKAMSGIGSLLSMRNRGGSRYTILQTDGGNTIAVRLSDHAANGNNFGQDNADSNLSIVIERRRFDAMPSEIEFTEALIPLATFESQPKAVVDAIVKGVEDVLADRSFTLSPEIGIVEKKGNTVAETPKKLIQTRDKAYMEAVERGDMQTAQRLVEEAAKEAGYVAESEYQGTSAYNGAAPFNGYEWTKEERKEKWENDEFEGDWTLGDNLDFMGEDTQLHFLLNHPNGYYSASSMQKESINALRSAIRNGERKIKVYRSVPSDVKEGTLRDGDWVTPSLSYAKDNAAVHGRGRKYRIIEQEVDFDELWWDGNDVNEWGYDSGSNSAYKNTKNNRKLLDAVTYDDRGNILPLSQRFDHKKSDVRYLRDAKGVVYGWTVGGKVYLNRDAMNPETPVHEYTHLWDEMVRKENPELWARGKELMKQTPLWDEVVNDPNYADIRNDEDAVAGEVHSRLTGKRGRERIEAMMSEAGAEGDYVEKAKKISLVQRLKGWLGDMLRSLKGTLEKWSRRELDDLTAEDFSDMTLRDLAKGLNPNTEMHRGEQSRKVIEANPMLDDYHTGIRRREDVMTFAEIHEDAERAYKEYGDMIYPDTSIGMYREAARTGIITVYSSYPIKTGTFVTPSRMNAEDYAGGGKVYEKQVRVDDVAWIAADEGEYAPVGDTDAAKGVRFDVAMSRSRADFDALRDRAVAERGIVMQGLNEAEVRVVEVPRHDFKGTVKQALQEGEKWARTNIVGEHEAFDSDGNKFIYDISNRSVRKYLSKSAIEKSDNLGVHLSVLKELPEIIGSSIETEIHPDYVKRDGKRSSKNGYDQSRLIHRFYGVANIDGQLYRVKTTIIESGIGDKNKPHSFEVTTVELTDEAAGQHERDGTASTLSRYSGTPLEEGHAVMSATLPAAKLLKGVEKSYEPGKKLLDCSAAGEPVNARQQEMAQTSPEAKSDHAVRMSKKFNTPIRIVNDPKELKSANAGVQERMRRSKGFYDPATGEVVVVVANNATVEDMAETVFHEVVAHRGLREMIGEENYDAFCDEVYNHLKDDLKKEVDEEAARRFVNEPGKGYEHHRRVAVDEMFGRMSEKGFEDFTKAERGIWAKLKAKVLEAINKFLGSLKLPKWVKLGDNELRYMLWRSHERLRTKGDYVEMARDAAKREELGLTTEARFRDGETGDIWKDQSVGLEERITNAAIRLSNNQSGDLTLRNDAMRAIGGNLTSLRRAMSAQKAFDRATVKRVADLARILMQNGYLSDMTSGEMQRLISAVKNSVGHKEVKESVQKVMDIMVQNQLRNGEGTLRHLLAIKGSKVNSKGQEVQGDLDATGQTMVRAFKDAISVPITADENGLPVLTHIDTAIEDALRRMESDVDMIADTAAAEYAGLIFAKEYAETIGVRKLAEKNHRKALAEAEDKKRAGEMGANAFRQFADAIEDEIRSNRIEMAQAYYDLVAKLSGSLRESVENARAFKEAEKARIAKIRHLANADMEGRPLKGHRDATKMQKTLNNVYVRWPFETLSTFDQMLKMFGSHNSNGQGYLHDYFMRSWIDAADKEHTLKEKYHKQMDDKAAEIFGKRKVWWNGGLKSVAYGFKDLYEYADAMKSAYVTYHDGAEMREFELSQGVLLSIYAVDKMPLGRATNRNMGITDDVMEQITVVLDPKLKAYADWVQEEFLPGTRIDIDEVYVKIQGAHLDAIENYFPFLRDKHALKRDVQNGQRSQPNDRAGVMGAGLFKKRVNSVSTWDIPNYNFFDVLARHIEDAAHDTAFAEFNRDLGTLLSYNRFQQQVMAMSSVYGRGEKLLQRFKEVGAIAAGGYEPRRSDFDALTVQMAKGVTMGKIAFRLFTGVKQVLSMPAFFGEVNLKYIAKDLAGGGLPALQWAWKNMPNFRKRILERTAGDYRLRENEYDNRIMKAVWAPGKIGMLPNIAVDAWTIAIGAHGHYQTMKAKYLRWGMEEAKAEKRAIQDAELCFNKSQQSSEGAFMAPIQVDHTLWSTVTMLFRNSSTSYSREAHNAARNLKRIMSGEVNVDFMAKQWLRIMEVKTFGQRFNEELAQQVAGTLPVGHIYQLGKPGGILQSAGFPDMPIELSATRLAEKANQGNHVFPIGAVKGLVEALNRPFAVFRYGNNAMNVIVGLNYQGKQFLVGVHFNQTHRGAEVSDIRGIFPKDNAEWLNWITQGKATYLDHRKIQALIDKQRINLAEVDYLDLDEVAKVMENFDNPAIPTQKNNNEWSEDDWSRARKYAKEEIRHDIVRNGVNLIIFGWILPWLWRIGGISPLLLLSSDDDEKQKQIADATKNSVFAPMEGLAYGDVMNDVLTKGTGLVDKRWRDIGRGNPLFDDLIQAFVDLDKDFVAGCNDLFNIIGGMATGVNPQTVTDWVVAIMDASNDNETRNETAILVARLMNCPQSQLDKIYFDEIDMSGEEASKLTPEQLAQRYAEYKVMRGTPLAPWTWDDEKRLGKYKDLAKKRMVERLKRQGDSAVIEAYADYEGRHKAFKQKIEDAKALMKTDSVAGAGAYAELRQDPDAGIYRQFGKLNGQLSQLSKMWLTTMTPEEANLVATTILSYRAGMVKVLRAETAEAKQSALTELTTLMNGFYSKYRAMQPKPMQPNR